MEEEASLPSHERAIDSGSSATEESPGILAEMGHGGIGVMEVREHDDPVVGDDVGNEVVLGEGGDAGVIGPRSEESDPSGQADISDNNWDTIRLAE